ncbi:hypothetical protein WA026_005510 [Henosepilachna vigintioctopunctata]|uniref:Uncharacterized protein n=1 Tax=Henosepilachna vigintioctopunctata TaxID=420089 RepID=A0AAW1TWJ8_9CUCU
MVCCTPVCQKWTTFGFSAGFLISGFLLTFGWESLFNSILHKQLILEDGTMQYDTWTNSPVDLYMEVYLFNWTNAEDYEKTGIWTKPRLEELGPYTYSLHSSRVNVKENDDNSLSYNSIRTYKFVPEKTTGSIEDEIIVINPIIMSIAGLMKDKHPLVKLAVHHFLKRSNSSLVLTTKVRDYTFDGVSSLILDVGRRLKFVEGYGIPFNNFSCFYGRNGSATFDGDFRIWTGKDDIRKTGVMYEWNNKTVSKGYVGECSKIDGSSGEVFYPVKDDTIFPLFQSDFCGKVILERDGSYTKDGIEGNRYVSTDRMLDNGNKYPETKCYSPDGYLASGVRDMSACQYHAPAFLSLPHFYLADESYRTALEGMKPDPKKHKMYYVIEPNLGFPLDVHITFQANMMLYNVKYIGMLENVDDAMVPMVWARVSSGIPEDYIPLIKLAIAAPLIGLCIGYSFIVLGLLLFMLGVFMEIRLSKGELTYYGYLHSKFSHKKFKVSSTASL